MKNDILTVPGVYKEGVVIPKAKLSFTKPKRVLVVFPEEKSNTKENGSDVWNSILSAKGIWKDEGGVEYTKKVREESEERLKRMGL